MKLPKSSHTTRVSVEGHPPPPTQRLEGNRRNRGRERSREKEGKRQRDDDSLTSSEFRDPKWGRKGRMAGRGAGQLLLLL